MQVSQKGTETDQAKNSLIVLPYLRNQPNLRILSHPLHCRRDRASRVDGRQMATEFIGREYVTVDVDAVGCMCGRTVDRGVV